MRVLHCIPNMAGGGAERQLTYLVKSQLELGLDVHVCLCSGGQNMERLLATVVPVHLLGQYNNHNPLILIKLIKIIRKLQPDIVQTWLLQMDVFGGLAALINRVPFILSERSSAEGYPHNIKWFLRKVVGRYSSAVIANSIEGANYWKAILPSNHPRFVIPNSVPIEEISKSRPFMPDCLELPVDAPLILFVGRLTPGKRVGLLLDAFKQALERTQAVLLICGQGSELASLKKMVAADDLLSQHVLFLSYQANIWGLMKTCDAFVSLSSYEGCPNAVIEAAASGLPLLLSDIPGHRDIAGEYATYTTDDLKDTSRKLIELIDTNKKKPHSNSSYIIDFIKFSPRDTAINYNRLYQSVLDTKKYMTKGMWP